jgi:hypothetical protein
MIEFYPSISGDEEELGPIYDAERTEHLDEDPDSSENLGGFELVDIDDESQTPIEERLDTEIFGEVKRVVAPYGWAETDTMGEQDFLDLCNQLGIHPEVQDAIIAIEDIGFFLERKNFEARTIDRIPAFKEIEEEAENIEELAIFQDTETIEAYLDLSAILTDTLLNKSVLLANRIRLTSALDEMRKEGISSLEDFDEERRLSADLESTQRQIYDLTSNEVVLKRRERSLRRMKWAIDQDYLQEPLKNYLAEQAIKGTKPDLHGFTQWLVGWHEDVLLTKKFEGQTDDTLIALSPEEAVATKRYHKGAIETLLERHHEEMAVQTGKTSTDRANELVMLRRLEQARALCRNVFAKDLEDRIYLGSPILIEEQEELDFVRERVYNRSDSEILEEFIDLLPGSSFRVRHNPELDSVPLTRFSGRTLQELFADIDQVIEEHLSDGEDIRDLVEKYQKHPLKDKEVTISKAEVNKLMTSAFQIVEKLAYKENYKIRKLIREELPE